MTSIVIDMFRKAEVMTDMNAEHVDVLNAKIATLTDERDEAVRISNSYRLATEDYRQRASMISFILRQYVDEYGIDDLDDYISESTYDASMIRDILVDFEAVPENTFTREYSVTVTVPVTVTVEVEAANEDDAEEQARDMIDMNGIDDYHMDYNTHYDMEIVEVREI